jgi:hypothetical protein
VMDATKAELYRPLGKEGFPERTSPQTQKKWGL